MATKRKALLDSVTGAVPVTEGGTGATTAGEALTAIGAAASASFIAGAGALTGPAAPLTIGTAAASAVGDFAPALGVDDNYVTDAEKVVIGNTSGTNSGNETAASIGTIINGATADTTPLDADKFTFYDAVDAALKACTWANVKSLLGAIYSPLAGSSSIVTVGTISAGNVVGGIADKALAISKLADGTDGELITWGADGVITTVPVGTATHVLTSNGAGAAPTFQAAVGGGANVALSNLSGVAINTDLVSDTADTDSLGSATKEWLNLYIGDVGKAYFGLGQDTSIHRSAANEITLTASGGVLLTGPLGITGTRVSKGWFTDLEVTNAIAGSVTGNAATVTGFTPASGSLTLAGADALTLTTLGVTDVTLPTTGTLSTLAGTEELDNKTLDSSVGKGTWTASGTWTLPAITAGGNITLAENATIDLDPAGSADEKWSGISVTGTAGATLAVGDLVYLDVTAGEWLLADADAASTSGDVPLAICILAANDGQATNLLLHGTIRSAAFPASIALGAPVYVSTTAGDIQAAQPTETDDVIRRVGWAITVEPNTILFNPSPDYITHV